MRVKENLYLLSDGSVDLQLWLDHVASIRPELDLELIKHACFIARFAGENTPAITGLSCFQQGLAIADILLDLDLDRSAIAAGLILTSAKYAGLKLEDIEEHLSVNVARQVIGAMKMDAVQVIHEDLLNKHTKLEGIRKMLLAMVDDMRVVIIKLAEYITIMRALDFFDINTQNRYANDALNIYAPLASRLGVGELRWELEDLGFKHIDFKNYKLIADYIGETRIEREKYLNTFTKNLDELLALNKIENYQIKARAKHIYSVYKKMLKKNLKLEDVCDLNAVRILVETVEDCYLVLGIVHNAFKQVDGEFDDYIAVPKPNGYRSIHLAVYAESKQIIEIQIRTYKIHDESEHGGAAHWRYKESHLRHNIDYEQKIAWLRQVLAWQKGLVGTGLVPDYEQLAYVDDNVYILTPKCDVIDLPKGSTPLDFAYHIHSEVGHRCKGAKVNGNIVPLHHKLNTCDKVEILQNKYPNPKRDWLNSDLGYVKTARAKAHIHRWFKHQEYEQRAIDGENLFHKELQKLNIFHFDLEKLAKKLHFASPKDMFASLACSELRISQIIGAIQTEKVTEQKNKSLNLPVKALIRAKEISGINISGIDRLQIHIAKCCEPIPGDNIIGYITHGHGIVVHKQICKIFKQVMSDKQDRLVQADWGNKKGEHFYPITILISTKLDADQNVIKDIVSSISQIKCKIKDTKIIDAKKILLSVDVPDIATLELILDRIKHTKNILKCSRKN